MTDMIGGCWLDEPQLRFDYEDRYAVSRDAHNGLRKSGPYDLAERRKLGRTVVRALVVGKQDRASVIPDVKAALESRRMGKLHDVFNVEIVDELRVSVQDPRKEADAYRDAVRKWLDRQRGEQGIDLAFVLHEDEEYYRSRAKGQSPYYSSKATFLLAGIPTQSLCYKNVGPRRIDQFRKYHLANVLTACYAKIGGKPWVIQDNATGRPEITVGVATTSVHDFASGGVERFVGISTIFKENGAFALWHLTPLQQSLKAYERSLEDSIVEAVEQYEMMEGRRVARIACHVSGKRAGRRELRAIQRGLARLEPRSISTDLVHITDDAALWLFDGRDISHRPEGGFLTFLDAGGRMALLHTEGRNSARRRQFAPKPLKMGIQGELPPDGCRDVYQHIYDLRWMSWRGVGTASKPVSIDYPGRMARLLAELYRQEEVEAIDFLPRLHTSAWFL